jgi:GntR family transcriptional regulator
LILSLDLHGGVPIYRQVMDQVRRQILIGHLAVGEQVESVKSLSSRLKINPMTVSKAYGFLVEEGLLERRPGVGLFVRSIRKDIRRRQQDRMLDRAMSRVAALAIQMGIPEKEALRLFADRYRKFESRTESEQP